VGQRSHRNIGQEWLRELYETRQMSLDEVAAETGMSTKTVWRRLVEYGIPTRHRGLRGAAPYARASDVLTSSTLQELAIAEGLSAAEIGRRFGFDDGTVMRYLRAAGIVQSYDPSVASSTKNTPGTGGFNQSGVSANLARSFSIPEVSEAALRDLYENQRLSLAQVSASTGLSTKTVWRRLTAHGIPTRRSSPTPQPEPYARPATILTRQLLEQLVVGDGISAAEIGRRTGFAGDTVRRYIRAADLPVGPRSAPTHHFNPVVLAELRANGWSQGRIAHEYGCAPGTVARALRRAGLPTRRLVASSESRKPTDVGSIAEGRRPFER
jgi:predicted DNA-binding transcriptional regulator AlpA/lambda repressor-like predicted transcriptional regulator